MDSGNIFGNNLTFRNSVWWH